jgi:type II secretory pathway pseudopilin PulG
MIDQASTSGRHPREAGFTIIELIITMGIMLAVLAGATQIMTSAMRSEEAAKDMLDMNSHLRAAMDLVQRDMLQVGQGLPVGRRIGIPNGNGANPIVRPGPAQSGPCAGVSFFPPDSTLPALSVGAGLGPPLNGECTDIITTLSADNLFLQPDNQPVNVVAISANGTTATIHDSINISDDPDANFDNLHKGDLLMLAKGNTSVLMQVTAVNGQVVTFGTDPADDPLGLNQFDTNTDEDNEFIGTINDLKVLAPADPDAPVVVNGVQQRGPTQATRIRMVTYFVDVDTVPEVPRLVRIVGGEQANAIGLGVSALRLTYDIADGVNNPAGVRMNDDDLDGSGACDNPQTAEAEPCSENQIRKVNILMSMRANGDGNPTGLGGGRQAQNTLYTQVSLRSMAFVDRYR